MSGDRIGTEPTKDRSVRVVPYINKRTGEVWFKLSNHRIPIAGTKATLVERATMEVVHFVMNRIDTELLAKACDNGECYEAFDQNQMCMLNRVSKVRDGYGVHSDRPKHSHGKYFAVAGPKTKTSALA